jgi:hypothetical protein
VELALAQAVKKADPLLECGVCGLLLVGARRGWQTCRYCGRRVHTLCMVDAVERDCGCRERRRPRGT